MTTTREATVERYEEVGIGHGRSFIQTRVRYRLHFDTVTGEPMTSGGFRTKREAVEHAGYLGLTVVR